MVVLGYLCDIAGVYIHTSDPRLQHKEDWIKGNQPYPGRTQGPKHQDDNEKIEQKHPQQNGRSNI